MKYEIRYSKATAERVLDGAKPTWMGYPKGARRQYRKGRLHIREYDDKFLVHEDRVDPRVDPLGHLVYDAPEVVAGLVGAIVGGLAASYMHKRSGAWGSSAAVGVTASIALGYLCYRVAAKMRQHKGD